MTTDTASTSKKGPKKTSTGANGPAADEPMPMNVRAANVDRELVLRWYRLAYMTRSMDERASIYIRRSMGWSYHARCSGHEAIQIAMGLSFRANKDFLFPYYRDMGTALAAGLSPYELFLNGLSRDDDPCSGGRHMSNHFGKPSIGVQNVSSCTGNHTLHGVGVARAAKYYKSDAIAFTSQGESSTSEGYCFEAFNGAAREKLPVIFVVQNNGYGISVPTYEQTANHEQVGQNYIGIKHLKVIECDGTDFWDSWRGMQEALAWVKAENGPALVSAKCVRIGAHSNSDAHDLYREDDEIADVKRFDPVSRLRAQILREHILDDDGLKKIEADVDAVLDADGARAEAAALPRPESIYDFVIPDAYDPVANGADVEPPTGEGEEKLREAINRTLIEEFERNPDTFLWGQDVASKEKGGVFNLTKGMLQKFGSGRVFNGPIAEDFIVGTANGMCRFDPKIHVVIEAAQFADYVWPAMEQIVEIGHEYWRTKGQFSPNVVCRLASGGYITGGLYHSQNVEAIMSHLPGVRVVYPCFADDAAGMLRTAMRSKGVTFFLEPKFLYNRKEARTPPASSNFCVPFGEGRVRRAGEDLSIITYGNTVHLSLDVAEKLATEGHSVEVFDLRSIKPIDEEGIKASVRRTGKVLVVHEDHMFNGIGSEVAAIIARDCFQDLDGPIVRVAAKDIPIGFSPVLEKATLPQSADIEKAARDLLAY